MRERVAIYLQGASFDASYMLPTFEAYENIENELAAVPLVLAYHQQKRLPIEHLAQIVEIGLRAGEPDVNWGVSAIKKALYELGPSSDDVCQPITELLERLTYTPEQYAEKKSQEQADGDKEADLLAALLGGFSP